MRKWMYVLGSAIWMSVIFYLSSLPGDLLGPDDLALNAVKKVGHFIIFGVLAVLYLYALKNGKPLEETRGAVYLLSLFLVVLYAVSDEYHQAFIPGRHAAIMDVLIDACGALALLGPLYKVKTGQKAVRGTIRHGKTADH